MQIIWVIHYFVCVTMCGIIVFPALYSMHFHFESRLCLASVLQMPAFYPSVLSVFSSAVSFFLNSVATFSQAHSSRPAAFLAIISSMSFIT